MRHLSIIKVEEQSEWFCSHRGKNQAILEMSAL